MMSTLWWGVFACLPSPTIRLLLSPRQTSAHRLLSDHMRSLNACRVTACRTDGREHSGEPRLRRKSSRLRKRSSARTARRGATIRGIARRAGVDPSLVLQHYGSKHALFALAVRPAADLTGDSVSAHLREVLHNRVHELPAATRALIRSMLTSSEAAAVMREYLQERTSNLAGSMPGDDAELRAALMVSSILGITIARHFFELAPLVDVDDAQFATVTDRWLGLF